ncbi:MAG: hypothetical protein WHS88_06090 [Anaerohalosphaeraceae bacterium]
MSSTQGNLSKIPRYVNLAKSLGLNTVIVYGCSFAETSKHLNYYREWFRLCNQAELHIFAFYPWQPPAGNACRKVVFADGTEGLFPCPLDSKLWKQYLTEDMANRLARVSVESPLLSFDGFFIDMEQYRTEELPEEHKQYSYNTCFCDFCFSSFLFTQGYTGSTLPPVEKEARKQWLSQRGLLENYFAYLSSEVQAKATELRRKIHAVNPNLLFGVYPALTETNWVLQALMRGLCEDSYPVISFTTDTYGYYQEPWGADRIPNDLDAYFQKYNIRGLYAAGYLLRAYKSSELRDHLVKSAQRAHGYWLYRIPQLVDENIPSSEKLLEGSRADYQQAVRAANAAIQRP